MELSHFYAREGLHIMSNALKFCARFPRHIRVRRRGFRASVKRGDSVTHNGKRWTVARRSNWSLWLYEFVPYRRTGNTITVKIPRRFEVTH